MSDPFIAEIKILTYTFAPLDWANCNGQLITLPQNPALFSLISTKFGGDGKNTFGLPDLQGRAVVGTGQGQGLSPYQWGAYGGSNTETINSFQLPVHTHVAQMAVAPATQNQASGNYLSIMREMNSPTPTSQKIYDTGATPDSNMAPQTLTPAFGSTGPAAHENRQPFLALRFCIALQGIYPMKS